MSAWRKCDTCRKVRPTEEFDGDSPTCRDCLTPQPVSRRATAVTTKRAATSRPAAPPAAPAAVRGPLLGSVGSGDLEVRERRARRTANEALAAAYPEEYGQLLREARAAEGLRAMAPTPAPSPAPSLDPPPAPALAPAPGPSPGAATEPDGD